MLCDFRERDSQASSGHTANGIVYAVVQDDMLEVCHAGRGDAFIAKYDTDGNQVWTRQFGAAAYGRPYLITTDAAGDVYLVGETSGTSVGRAWVSVTCS